MQEVCLGIDVGSTTVKVVVLDTLRSLLSWRYERSHGDPRRTLQNLITELRGEVDLCRVVGVGLTGSGGAPIARLLGGQHVNELVAQTCALGYHHPEARSVIEIGGQDSKFLSVAWDGANERMVLRDFAMNALCAAGTGAFLDQQAERLGIAIDSEFAALALQSTTPARIAGRCTVFAKSDMIHLQQQGTPLPDILAGLCLALARNFKSVIAKGKAFTAPVVFQGGLASNAAVVRAFETVLELGPGTLIVPEHNVLMAALGTGYIALVDAMDGGSPPFVGIGEALDRLAVRDRLEDGKHRVLVPLRVSGMRTASVSDQANGAPPDQPLPVFVGIDVGSISTNVVLVDEQAQVVARRYLLTAGRPLAAVARGLAEVGAEVGMSVEVRGVGATGSGRHLTGEYVGADVVRNEITAQACAATQIDPDVDTVFEIGGQDSKYIRLDHGTIVDFTMNSACAAGTGAFLEEQADWLGVDIKGEFSHLACSSDRPTCLGERCTVFMQSDLVHHQQRGACTSDLTAGLACAIAENYLNRVVNRRALGRHIFFQGGVAGNESVVAALEALTRRPITVPPNHDVTGAIGAALLARDEMTRRRQQGIVAPSRFKGFDLSDRRYEASTFECRACPNLCEISKIMIAGEPPIYYGARCDRFEEAGRERGGGATTAALPDLYAEREALLLGPYQPPVRRPGRLRVGLPRALTFYDLFPYWRTLFAALDVDLVISNATTATTVKQTAERAAVETCFPAKLLFGHVAELLEQDVDLVFLPGVINRENALPGQAENNYCTYIPAMPHLVTANFDFSQHRARPLKVPLHLLWPKIRRRELAELAKRLGVDRRRMAAADVAARTAQQAFYASLQRRGHAVLDAMPADQVAAVIIGRPYNTCDPGACQDLPRKLGRLGILPIPMDFLPTADVGLPDRYGEMYWRGGQAILSAAQVIRDDPRLQAIYVTSFGCGPDSFLLSFFRRTLGDKPFLELELDEHTADAGVVTRCEAFFESLQTRRMVVAS